MTTQKRLRSLDVFRGITVALMIIVNSPGNAHPYVWLEHSIWNGCTFADVVFPFFIFIVGMSIACAMNNKRDCQSLQLYFNIFKRSLILFAIGLLLNAFPYHFDLNTIRIYGVLQRIALCYFFASVLFLNFSARNQVIIFILLLLGYYLVMCFPTAFGLNFYDLSPDNNLAAYVDRALFSSTHLYAKTSDPEGLLSTLPSLATALLGTLTGVWMLSNRTSLQKLAGLVFAGSAAMLLGWIWSFGFPINKSLWTSPYVLWTGGMALLVFAVCYALIDMKSWLRGAKVFQLFGLYAMTAYILHVLFLKIQTMITLTNQHGDVINLRVYITEHLFSQVSLSNASLGYSLSYMAFWWLVIQLFVSWRLLKKSSQTIGDLDA